jgi:hypothetical protein
LDDELNKVPVRMSMGLERPESYSDARVSNLVNILNTYDNFIDTFESIELEDNSNCLDRDRYLISHDLHNVLINGYRLKRDRTINKNEEGIYIVVFKHVKIEGKKTLIYKYIKYPYILYDLIYKYITIESSSLVITNGNSIGTDFLFVMENFAFRKDEISPIVRDLAENFLLRSFNSKGIFPRNVIDMLKMLLHGCSIFLDKSEICEFIKLSSERKIYDLLVKMVNLYNLYESEKQQEGLRILREGLDKVNYVNYNFLGKVVFVTNDLDSLINKIRLSYDKGVNPGPQK